MIGIFVTFLREDDLYGHVDTHLSYTVFKCLFFVLERGVSIYSLRCAISPINVWSF